jgi:hypothetical protein
METIYLMYIKNVIHIVIMNNIITDYPLLIYYIVKRFFLFLDEWLFYYILYRLFESKYYKLLIIVLFYGLSCIYTSYSNLEIIEYKLTGINQKIWIINNFSFF